MDEQRMEDAHGWIPSFEDVVPLAGGVSTVVTILAVSIFSTGCGQGDPAGREAPDGASVEGHKVVIRMTDEMRFEPEHPVIAPGDTVEWVNVGALEHTSTARPEAARLPENVVLPTGSEPWDSALMGPGERFVRVFDVAGEYAYLCIPHESLGMIGRITVREAPAEER